MTALASRDCAPASAGARPLKGAEMRALLAQLGKSWKVVRGRSLEREFKFKDFRAALAFTNRVGAVAEKQGHHPDVFLSYGKVKLALSTHDVGGLSENDFILAARLGKIRR
jgi:4a-hydroxytetrahydrobiopterin dehydratase